MASLYRATDSKYAEHGVGDFIWWTPCLQWAEGYGSAIIERDDADLNLLDLPLDGVAVRRALRRAGVDVDGLVFEMEIDDDIILEMEAHQVLLANGGDLAQRLAAAGYHGVRHPDHVDGRGVGEAVALIVG